MPRRGPLASWSGKRKGIFAGLVFGLIAICGTEFGVPITGAVINVRDAAPVVAGLIFGPNAGVLAGLIGGIERWFSVFWGRGEFTRLACTIATITAGVLAALLRKYLLEDRKPSWLLALAAGFVTEVLHLLLVFLTNLTEVEKAFEVVYACTAPMLIGVSLSCALSAFIVARLSTNKPAGKGEIRGIAQTIQMGMFLNTVLVFLVSAAFVTLLQLGLARARTQATLSTGVSDLRDDITDEVNDALLNLTRIIASEIAASGDDVTTESLQELVTTYGVSEISVVDSNGIITASSMKGAAGFDMATGVQSSEFLAMLDGQEEMVQQYGPTTHDSSNYLKYAAVAMGSGFVQVGFDAVEFQGMVRGEMYTLMLNRHVGNEGVLLITTDEGDLVVSTAGGGLSDEQVSTIYQAMKNADEQTIFLTALPTEKAFGLYLWCEGYYICALLPFSETYLSCQIGVMLTCFLEIISFAVVFITIFLLIRRLVIENIRKVNASLGRIIDGNLNTTVDVRDSSEFASLSDDINTTVGTLKRYIAEAETRLDTELEYARQIQVSALPRVFPPYPDHTEFEIFASMNAAKEVGGDFYDFYLIDPTHLALTIADVSGKGIPASLFMMKSMTILRSLAAAGVQPNELLMKANNELARSNDADMFVTVWLGIVDLEAGHVSFANGGHEIPSVRRGGEAEFAYITQKSDFVVAGMEGMPYRAQELDLAPGDVLYLYTDGVPEATNSAEEMFGMDRLRASLNARADASMEDICHGMYADVMAFTGDAEQFDDVTMIAFKYLGPSA